LNHFFALAVSHHADLQCGHIRTSVLRGFHS
jgi:hypothetical protein